MCIRDRDYTYETGLIDLFGAVGNQIQMVNIFLLIICVIVFWIGLKMISFLATQIVKPLENLLGVIKAIEEDDLDVSVASSLDQSSYEISNLYLTINRLKDIQKFLKHNEANSAVSLIRYVNALKLFQEVNNIRVCGAIQNNIGNIHLKQGRYEEALKYYEDAIQTAKKEEAIYNTEIERKKLGIGSEDDTKAKGDPYEALKNVDLLKMNRTHQWCTCMLAMPKKTPKQWKKLSERLHIVIQSDLKNHRNLPRVIKNLINMAHALTEQKSYKAAENVIEDAAKYLEVASVNIKTIQKEQEQMSSDVFYPEIIEQSLLFERARLAEKKGQYKKACVYYTDIITTGKIYDPAIRKQALLNLRDILTAQGLMKRAGNINRILEDFEPKNRDMVFLLDYSESMKGSRIQYAISIMISIFEKLINPNDRTALLRFNTTTYTVFNLLEKQRQTGYIRRQMENNNSPSGVSCLYDAINEALKEFDRSYDCLLYTSPSPRDQA
eukprot:TRINITY_DN1049_c0_g1_i1.p1 TRINITY_DN1049_c0_g1~~TRINITY_DN1049_c0_g1_i1.p1  ORF type:complete len:517 (+),score=135.18 TRINITY_DN1049_c0_g1_i1:69-1553(+)